MQKKTIILLILFAISIGVNFYLFTEVQKFKKADEKQLQIFTEVSDSLNVYRSRYRSDWQR